MTNLLMLASRSSVELCITFFVSFHILTLVDNIYAEGLSDFKLKEAVEEPLVFKVRFEESEFKKKAFG